MRMKQAQSGKPAAPFVLLTMLKISSSIAIRNDRSTKGNKRMFKTHYGRLALYCYATVAMFSYWLVRLVYVLDSTNPLVAARLGPTIVVGFILLLNAWFGMAAGKTCTAYYNSSGLVNKNKSRSAYELDRKNFLILTALAAAFGFALFPVKILVIFLGFSFLIFSAGAFHELFSIEKDGGVCRQ